MKGDEGRPIRDVQRVLRIAAYRILVSKSVRAGGSVSSLRRYTGR